MHAGCYASFHYCGYIIATYEFMRYVYPYSSKLLQYTWGNLTILHLIGTPVILVKTVVILLQQNATYCTVDTSTVFQMKYDMC